MKKLLVLFLVPLFLFGDVIFNGFGTAMVTTVDDNNNPRLMYQDQKSQDGKEYDISSGTLFGLQGSLISEDYQIVGQTIFRESVEKDIYKPRLEWLFVKSSFFEDLEVSIGRLKLDTFLYSKTMYVDFVRPFMKMPSEVYTAFPFTHHDGVDFAYSKMFGDYKLSSTISLSKKNESNIGEVEGRPGLQMDKGRLISLCVENGDLLIKATYLKGLLSVMNGGNMPANLSMEDDIVLSTIGLEYFINNFKIGAEYLYRKTDIIENIKSYYISLSYDINPSFTPYCYYANMESYRTKTPPAMPNMPAMPDMNTNEPMKTYVIGNRYNFSESLSIKSEFKHIVDTSTNDKIDTFALSFDFIF
jgi:hypothetical protein